MTTRLRQHRDRKIRRYVRLSVVALLGVLLPGLVVVSCGDTDAFLGGKGAAPGSRALIVYDHPPEFCADTDPGGTPNSPARPLWSALEGAHPDDGLSRYPDYQELSKNFNILRSLQLLLSVFTNSVGKLEDVQQQAEEGTLIENVVNQSIPQVPGHCVCKTGGCDPATIWMNVQTLVGQLGTVSGTGDTLLELLDTFLGTQIQGVIDDINDLVQHVSDLEAPEESCTDQVSSALDTAIYETTQDMTANASACDGVSDAFFCGAINDVSADAETELKGSLANDFVTLFQDVVDLIVSGDLQTLIDDLTALKNQFEGVSSADDLLTIDWTLFIATLTGAVTDLQAVITNVQSAITNLDSAWQDNAAYRNAMITSITADLDADPNFTGCYVALTDDNNFAGSSPFMMKLEAGLDPAVGDLLTSLLGNLTTTFDSLTALFNSSDGFFDTIVASVDSQIEVCYKKTTRNECCNHCSSSPCDSNDYLWMSVDFLEDPEATVAGAANATFFVLEQTGWLDQVSEWIADGFEGALGDAVGDVTKVLGNIAEVIARVLAFLGDLFEYIDRFGEGYHLGAYTDLRPDLHMCIGYAGHGAYAQMGDLNGGKFSIGARYSAHNLSEKHRAQFHSGGFAVSVLGKELSLAPSVELQIQLNGFKMWDETKPFGIPFDVDFNGDTAQRVDVLNVIPDDADLPNSMGGFAIRDLFPSINTDGVTQDWPRPGIIDPWEDESIATVSFGLNLPFEFDPARINITTITIYPGVTATPFFDNKFGMDWYHETNRMRDRILEKVNQNIAADLQLTVEDFEREMHAFQAPDLTQDDGTSVFVEPEFGFTVFAGFNISKLQVGVGADLSFAVNIRPGGFGGVADINAALGEAMVSSNPPADAPCEPTWSSESNEFCSNVGFEHSTGTYACDPSEQMGSCCIQVDVPGIGSHEVQAAMCLDAWTGITQTSCGFFDLVGLLEDVTTTLEGLPSFFDFVSDPLLNALKPAENGATATISATWNATQRCEDSTCTQGYDVILDTTGLSINSLSECAKHGYCTYESIDDITVIHDLTQDLCEASVPPGSIATFSPYVCKTTAQESLTGWVGDGCHPLQQGFPSACGCSSDNDCAAGESCDVAAGQCSDGSMGFSCICDEFGNCPTGRICSGGACVLECSSDEDCVGDRICDAGGCVPPHGIPTTESIVWGMSNVTPPIHMATSYAMSELYITLLLKFGLYVDLSFKLLGKEILWRPLEYFKLFDLGSSWKGWYEPGLEAYYQDECADPMLTWDMTNRFPRSLTATPQDGAFNTGGVPLARNCPNGGVCRYPTPVLPSSTIVDGEYTVTDGNAGSVAEFIEWCKDDMPKHKEDPDASTNDSIIQGVADTAQFGLDVAEEMLTGNYVCIDGITWNDWVAGLEPTYDGDGNVSDPGGFGDLQCSYDDPQTGMTHSFACKDFRSAMMAIWGCTTTDVLSENPLGFYFAQAHPGETIANPYGAGMIFDIDAMFVSVPGNAIDYGPGDVLEYNVEDLRSDLATALIPMGPTNFTVADWLNFVSQCVNERYSDPAETICECASDNDCDPDNNERCNNGACEIPLVHQDNGDCINMDCSPLWVRRECPIMAMTDVEPELCCGDGIVQAGEECDPEDPLTGGQCTEFCTFVPTFKGACCTGTGACVENLNSSSCRNDYGGSFFNGSDCESINYCVAPPCSLSSAPSCGGDCPSGGGCTPLTNHLCACVGQGGNPPQAKSQINCINALNKAAAKVMSTQGKENTRCIKSEGKLSTGAAQACLTADSKGKVFKAQQKLLATEAKFCAVPPDFGTGSGATINLAAKDAPLLLTEDVFGVPLDSAIIEVASNTEGALCQATFAKAYQKLLDTKMKSFLKCKKNGLKKGYIRSTSDLELCMAAVNADPKVSKTIAKLADTLNKKCVSVDPMIAFPGNCAGSPDLAACIDAQVECRFCNAINAIDALSTDCDLFDDGLANTSCSP